MGQDFEEHEIVGNDALGLSNRKRGCEEYDTDDEDCDAQSHYLIKRWKTDVILFDSKEESEESDER